MKKTVPQTGSRQNSNSGSQKYASPQVASAPGPANLRTFAELNAPEQVAKTPKNKKQRSWPLVEVVVVLLFLKIGFGAYYIWFGSPEEPATVSDMFSALATESELLATASGKATVTQLDKYLAAVSPAVAHAAIVPTNYSAVSAGAMMVMAGQNSAAATDAAIPLPPGAGDLWEPAAQLDVPSATKKGASLPSLPPQSEAATSSQLRVREQEIARREQLLVTKQNALNSLEAGLNQRLAVIEASRGEIEAMTRRNEAILAEQKALLAQQETEDEILRKARLAHLVTAYGGMKPEQAGSLVNNLDEDVAVSILAAMPGRKTGLVLAWVDPGKAARLTKAISEQRIDPNQILAEQPPGGGM